MAKKVFLIILIYVVFCSLFVEPNALNVTKYEIKDPLLKGIRVAFLSDMHLKRHDYKKLDKITKLTINQHPDLILLGGDYVKSKNLKAGIDTKIVAQKLRLANVPIVAVLGNYDWWANGGVVAEGFEKNGVSVLENSSKRVIVKQKYIDIVGIADLTTRQVDVDAAMRNTIMPRIVVSHNPDVYYDILDDVDLILAGHTHGGQFILPFSPPMFVPSKYGEEFASGLITPKHNKMIVSKGIGTSKVPFRFNCKPEIVIVDFI